MRMVIRMAIDIRLLEDGGTGSGNVDKFRYGAHSLDEIKITTPTQAITSKNLEHAKTMNVPSFDFGTKILEIIEKSPKDIISDPVYRNIRIGEIRKMINQNNDKLCFLVLRGEKSNPFSRVNCMVLIDFQIECGFTFIKGYFYRNKGAIKILKKYRDRMDEKHHLVPVLNENLDNSVFEEIYNAAYSDGAEIIMFLGKRPRINDDDFKTNMEFIRRNSEHQILRYVSSITKSYGGVVGSLLYNSVGFDVFSFRSRFGKTNGNMPTPQILREFKFVNLASENNAECVVTGRNLAQVVEEQMMEDPFVAIYIYNIVTLNNKFRTIAINYTPNELLVIIDGHES